MASSDIGIDLGTSTIIAMNRGTGAYIKEPSVVAVQRKTGKVLGVGTEVYKMIGRTPENIQVIRPLEDGVISDFKMTEVLIAYLLKAISKNKIFRPRVTICVPSGITDVESQAVIDAAVSAGARKVYLIEEPVAAAIGAGVEIARPNGNLVVDVGGGTCDIAVLSLNGIVCKTSLRVAGQKFDEVIIKYMRAQYNMLIGEKTAEAIKIEIGSVFDNGEDPVALVKGRDLLSGLPKKIEISRHEILPFLSETALQIVRATQGVLEITPPELVGDIRTNGIILTGGGALINGLDLLIEAGTKVPAKVADNAVDCVAMGTVKSFEYLNTLFDGFVHTSTHTH